MSSTPSESPLPVPKLIAIGLLLLATIVPIATASCMGCVELDEISFDKLIARFDYTLVKFDIAFPYGPKHEIYGDFAKNAGPRIANLLVGLVGVKDYGEKENRVLAQRYHVEDAAYPAIFLFLNGDNQRYVRYPNGWEITVENLKRFVKLHAKIYIPLDGCIELFDEMARDFGRQAVAVQTRAVERARIEWQGYDGEIKDRAEIYVRLMEKIVEKGANHFIADERKRVEKLLKEKISEKKRKQLVYKQNILQSFRTQFELESDKDEL